MVAPKKRITSELLHIALVITLLRGDTRRYALNNNVLSTNFFNDVHDLDHIEGPNWAYTRTNYHRLFIDPGAEQIKSLSGDFNPYYNPYDDSPNELEDEFEMDDNLYLQQWRLQMLGRLNSPYRIGKEAAPRFQDITAYLVSDTTSAVLPNSLAGLPEVQPPPPGSSSGGGSGLNAPSPSIDSGHEDSGDEGRVSTSESESDLDIVSSIFANQNEVNVSEDEGAIDDDELIRSKLIPQIPEEPGNVMLDVDLNTDWNQNLGLSDIDPEEFLFFLQNNQNDGSELGATALPAEQPPAFEIFDNADSPSLVSELFGLDDDEHGLPRYETEEDLEWSLAQEEASLSFYKNFNDISETEMMNSVSPFRIQGGVVVKVEEVETEDERTGSVPDVDDMQLQGAAAGTSSSHGDPTSSQEIKQEQVVVQDDIVTAIIDELWETDSGIFDFLDSPAAQPNERSFDFENLGSVDSSQLTEVDEESSSGDDSISDEMIQAAPIHANARPTSHPAQPRGFQVHARMPGLLRGGGMGMEQRWQELASFLNLQQPPNDGSGGPLPPSLSHPFAPHHHPHLNHHLHHSQAPPSLHHPSMHHPPFSSGGPPAALYNTDSTRSVLLQNATLPPPDLNSTTPYGMGPPPNLGSAVSSSMHLTNSSDPMIDPSSHYKMIEPSHDMIYYPNASNVEMHNQTTEGFLTSILNDDDLQLMDMAMNEGMYTMRMLDNGGSSSNVASLGAAAAIAHGPQPNLPHGAPGNVSSIGPGAIVPLNEDRMEASSDSAVSSMGSERIPPMTDPTVSDNEWVEPDSHPHSSHDSSPYSLDYSSGKLRGYDYYGKDRVPVAQKKHHMFGKRYQQEHGSHPYGLPSHPHPHLPYPSNGALHSNSSLDSLDMKYSCSIDFARHQNDIRGPGALGSGEPTHSNHTYSLPPSHPDNPLLTVRPPRQSAKEKQMKINEELDRFAEESLSRDEKRARAMSLPITTEDVINLPMDEFNERLSKYDLTEAQLSLIRDIRRRGKNKVAAQNCRKRKLDQILQLADEVQRIRERKQSLLREQRELAGRRDGLKDRYVHLYRHVFQALRDDGYSPDHYTLQQAADGNIILIPRNSSQPSTSSDSMNPSNSSRRDKSKDEFKKGEGQS